ncbi:hypothetical protein OPKNFCMD_4924 [Methylobacterium crusticola]|uniref:Uncharacterized protein n=1 Tax=Methylobacterium crusticola TaxID=1697972 RepID=A0ABQ4R5X4_9HYPH|nr:hypothetical protein OPKNFCMD_4924 [Methylobacterium crusticola]
MIWQYLGESRVDGGFTLMMSLIIGDIELS